MTEISGLSTERAMAYSPLSFLREERESLSEHVITGLASALDAGELRVTGERAGWYWRPMAWDSSYFGASMYRIDAAVWPEDEADPVSALATAAGQLLDMVGRDEETYYVWAELAGRGHARDPGPRPLRLPPGRDPADVLPAGRLVVGMARGLPGATRGCEDIPHLRSVASTARNRYDRYHVDSFFGSRGRRSIPRDVRRRIGPRPG